MKDKWTPCVCTIILGILVIVFTYWHVTWAATALTVLGVLIILKGLIGKCCCYNSKKKEGAGGGCCH